MSKQPKSHLKRLATFDYINSAILLLVAVCCVYPFLYVFFVATTDGTYLARGEMTFLPMGFNLKAFGYILTNPRFNVFAGMRNSFLYTALGTLLAVACTYVTACKDGKIHAAYAWGRRVRIKYVCVDEAWIRGAKVCKGAEDNPEMPCNR